jgi:hypothetical protein
MTRVGSRRHSNQSKDLVLPQPLQFLRQYTALNTANVVKQSINKKCNMLTTKLILHEWLFCTIEHSYNNFFTTISCTDTIKLISSLFSARHSNKYKYFSSYWNITKQESGAQKIYKQLWLFIAANVFWNVMPCSLVIKV